MREDEQTLFESISLVRLISTPEECRATFAGMQGEQIADTVEKLIDAKLAKQLKVAAGIWTAMDEKLHLNFVSKSKTELATFFPKNVLFIKDPKATE